MAEVAKGTGNDRPSISTLVPTPSQLISGGLLAGEAITAGDACHVASTGLVMKSSGAAANATAQVHGFAAVDAPSGGPVTLVHDVNMHYKSTGLPVPGTRLYLSATVAGGLADAATTGGVAPVAFVVDSTRIRVLMSRY